MEVMDNSKNTKELFKIVNKLTGSNTDNPLPPGRTSEETAENFAELFLNRINKIQQLIMGIPPYQPREQICQDLNALHQLHKKLEEK